MSRENKQIAASRSDDVHSEAHRPATARSVELETGSSPDLETALPGIHLPEPSVWPAALAAGIALLLFGVVTSLSLSALGALLLVWALVGWFGDLL